MDIETTHPISSELHPRLTTDIVGLLKNQQINTVLKFINTAPEKIAKCTNLTYKNVLLIRKHIIGKYCGSIQTGYENYLQSISNIAVISTGIKSLDDLLDGGLFTGNIYELYGATSSGKTQLCHTIILNVLLKHKQVVYYIDTKRDFNLRRIKQILNARNIVNKDTTDDLLQRIFIHEVMVLNELWDALNIKKYFDQRKNLRLIVIDNLASVFLPLTIEESKLGYLNHLSNQLKTIIKRHHVAILVVNSMNRWVEHNDLKAVGPNRNVMTPTLGNYWLSVPNFRLLISQSGYDSTHRKITVIKSTKSKQGEHVMVNIDERGLY